MNSSPFRSSLLLVSFLLTLAGQTPRPYKPKEEKVPGDPVKQPIAYSHKTHVSLGLKCTNCHTMPGDGFQATFPKESFCMGCHTTVKKESPEIRKLAEFASKKTAVPWNRVYQVPEMVWFNHLVHVKDAKLECAACHGDVGQRDVLFKEKSVQMNACMECHAQRMAPNGCDVCHSTQ